MVVFVFVILDFNGLLGQYSSPFILKFLVSKASFPPKDTKARLEKRRVFCNESLVNKSYAVLS